MAVFRVGLTGGIGSGKTAVTDYLCAQGIAVLDADTFSHQITARGQPAVQEIAAAFGPSVLTESGELDRRALRALVFDDPRKKEILERIVHPKVRAAMSAAAERTTGPYVVFSIPLLIETGQAGNFDYLVVIEAPRAARAERVRSRSGLDLEAFEKIDAAQASDEARRAAADEIIVNDGSLESLQSKLKMLHQKLIALAAKRGE